MILFPFFFDFIFCHILCFSFLVLKANDYVPFSPIWWNHHSEFKSWGESGAMLRVGRSREDGDSSGGGNGAGEDMDQIDWKKVEGEECGEEKLNWIK